MSFCADLTRGLAGGGRWLLMEHSVSAVNWQPVNVAKRPGEAVRDSLVHVARGAEGIAFFQWRASRAGAEKHHTGLVPHAGTGSRTWQEVLQLGRALRSLDEVRGTRVQADVAQLFDHQAWWANDAPSRPTELLRYLDAGRAVHRVLRSSGVTSDVVPVATADLAGVLAAHRVVVVPTLHLCTDATAEAVAGAAAAGAHVVVTCSSGVVDEHDHVRLGGYPGAFRDLLGVRMTEVLPLLPGEVLELEHGWRGTVWSEEGDVDDDVEVVARVLAGPVPGQPAVTRRALPGGGVAWYVATQLDDAAWDALLRRVLEEAGVQPAAAVRPGWKPSAASPTTLRAPTSSSSTTPGRSSACRREGRSCSAGRRSGVRWSSRRGARPSCGSTRAESCGSTRAERHPGGAPRGRRRRVTPSARGSSTPGTDLPPAGRRR